MPICSQSSNNSYSPASVNYRCYNWEPKVPLDLSSLYFYGSPIRSHGSLWPTHSFPLFFMADPFVPMVLRVLTGVFSGDQFPIIGNLKFQWTKFSFMAYPFCSESSQNSNNSLYLAQCLLPFPIIGNLKFHWTKFSLLWLTHLFPRFFIAYPFVPKILHALAICSQSSQSP